MWGKQPTTHTKYDPAYHRISSVMNKLTVISADQHSPTLGMQRKWFYFYRKLGEVGRVARPGVTFFGLWPPWGSKATVTPVTHFCCLGCPKLKSSLMANFIFWGKKELFTWDRWYRDSCIKTKKKEEESIMTSWRKGIWFICFLFLSISFKSFNKGFALQLLLIWK